VLKVHKVHKAVQVQLVLQVFRAVLVLQVFKVHKDPLV
jgi:hypothetical protein